MNEERPAEQGWRAPLVTIRDATFCGVMTGARRDRSCCRVHDGS
jgi:hypothetical protein